jgi:hypothetical protein
MTAAVLRLQALDVDAKRGWAVMLRRGEIFEVCYCRSETVHGLDIHSWAASDLSPWEIGCAHSTRTRTEPTYDRTETGSEPIVDVREPTH